MSINESAKIDTATIDGSQIGVLLTSISESVGSKDTTS